MGLFPRSKTKTNQDELRRLLKSFCDNIPNPEMIDVFMPVIEKAMEEAFAISDQSMHWTAADKRMIRFSVFAKLLLKTFIDYTN